MKCPKCKAELRTKESSERLNMSAVYLTTWCPQCGFRVEIVGQNDHNAIEQLASVVRGINRGINLNQKAS